MSKALFQINTRLDKIEKQVKAKTSSAEVGAGIKMLRMYINCGRNENYKLSEAEKISNAEWQEFILSDNTSHDNARMKAKNKLFLSGIPRQLAAR